MNDSAWALRTRGEAPPPGVAVRPAATVMLVRDGTGHGRDAHLEVLMLRRHPDSAFAAGAWVFPGGALDPADAHPRAVSCGPTDAEASVILGVPSGGLAYWVAATRECFEEAGILLARHAGSGAWLDTSAQWDAARFARHRRDVHAGRRPFYDVLAAEGLVLDLGGLHYVSHWITPPGSTRRFDTRFFVTAAPARQTASHDASETVESAWITPREALERHTTGSVPLMSPTVKNLEVLSGFRTVADLLVADPSTGSVPEPPNPERPCPI